MLSLPASSVYAAMLIISRLQLPSQRTGTRVVLIFPSSSQEKENVHISPNVELQFFSMQTKYLLFKFVKNHKGFKCCRDCNNFIFSHTQKPLSIEAELM